MQVIPFSLIIVALGATSACTSVPVAGDDFLSSSNRLEAAKGMRGKRLATPPPSPPIEAGAKLRIIPVQFTQSAFVSEQITPAERALIENVLARNACKDFSKHFEIVETSEADLPTFQLRIGISSLAATGKIGAGVGVVTGMASPIGLRPPIGLGALTVEFELVRPDNTQAAAMVWSRKADLMSTDTATSRIGDAYNFAADATSDFENLASTQTPTQTRVSRAMRSIPNPLAKADTACEIYGQGANRAAQAVGFLGLPLPPEMIDKGRQP
jgi:hypothetical protein